MLRNPNLDKLRAVQITTNTLGLARPSGLLYSGLATVPDGPIIEPVLTSPYHFAARSHHGRIAPLKMGFFRGLTSFITGFVAPIFIIISPITSYADQTYAIHRTKSSAGFSLDIPLIMLVASILRYVSELRSRTQGFGGHCFETWIMTIA